MKSGWKGVLSRGNSMCKARWQRGIGRYKILKNSYYGKIAKHILLRQRKRVKS